MPLMGSIAVPQGKFFLCAVEGGCAGKVDAHTVPVLICRQFFSMVIVIISPLLSRKRNLKGVIFPSVSVQDIICTGMSIHKIFSIISALSKNISLI